MPVRRSEILKLSIIIVTMSLFSVIKLYAYDDSDFQVWNTDLEEVQLKQDLKLVFEQEFRWANNASELYYMLLSLKSAGVWKDCNILGTKVKVSF